MKQEFINFIKALMAAAPEVEITDGAKAYLDTLLNGEADKPEITDSGKVILKYLQGVPVGAYKAKDIAEELFTSSRAVSGAIRKLVTDGFVEKLGSDPVIYSITEKGKNFIID